MGPRIVQLNELDLAPLEKLGGQLPPMFLGVDLFVKERLNWDR
jgi:hypothetical protein